jgi:hypothetical protein
LQDKFSAFDKNNKLGLMEADGKLKHASKEIARLQDNVKKLKAQLEVGSWLNSYRVAKKLRACGYHP